MKLRLLVSDEAYGDIVEAINYYKSLSSEYLEDRFREELRTGMAYIVQHPRHFAIKYRKIRIYNLSKFPYQIHFLLDDKTVMVFGVFHAKSNPVSWEDRIKT